MRVGQRLRIDTMKRNITLYEKWSAEEKEMWRKGAHVITDIFSDSETVTYLSDLIVGKTIVGCLTYTSREDNFDQSLGDRFFQINFSDKRCLRFRIVNPLVKIEVQEGEWQHGRKAKSRKTKRS